MELKSAVITGAAALLGAVLGSVIPLLFLQQQAQIQTEALLRQNIINSTFSYEATDGVAAVFAKTIMDHLVYAVVAKENRLKEINEIGAALCYNNWSKKCESVGMLRLQSLREFVGNDPIDQQVLYDYTEPAYEAIRLLNQEPQKFFQDQSNN